MVNESILDTVKVICNVSVDDTSFDDELMIHINSMLIRCNQLGIGTRNYAITSKNNVWSEFITGSRYNPVKMFIGLSVKLLFDPPVNSSVLTSLQNSINKYEWLLNDALEEEDAIN